MITMNTCKGLEIEVTEKEDGTLNVIRKDHLGVVTRDLIINKEDLQKYIFNN